MCLSRVISLEGETIDNNRTNKKRKLARERIVFWDPAKFYFESKRGVAISK